MSLSKTETQILYILQTSAITTAPLAITSFCIWIWYNPCLPFSLGKTLLVECSESYKIAGTFSPELSLNSKVLMLFICKVNFMVWINTCGEYMFTLVQFSFVQCCCFTRFGRGFKMKCQNSVRSKQANNLQLSSMLQMYNQIHIIVQYYNNIQQNLPIIFYLAFSIFAFVLSTFALVKNGTNTAPIEINLFGSAAMDGCYALVVIFGTFGRLHMETSNIVKYLQIRFMSENKNIRGYNLKLNKRLMLSLTPVKVQFGSVNFIDRMTPIVALDFCFVQLANLLLCT